MVGNPPLKDILNHSSMILKNKIVPGGHLSFSKENKMSVKENVLEISDAQRTKRKLPVNKSALSSSPQSVYGMFCVFPIDLIVFSLPVFPDMSILIQN